MLDLISNVFSTVVAYVGLFGILDWVSIIGLVILFTIICILVLTHEPKRSLMDSHHYTMYRKLAGKASKPFEEVKHFTVCTAQDGSKVLMDLGAGLGKRKIIQQL